MLDEDYDDYVPPEEYWSDAHSMALSHYNYVEDFDWMEDVDFWESYEEDYCDDFETLYEDDQA